VIINFLIPDAGLRNCRALFVIKLHAVIDLQKVLVSEKHLKVQKQTEDKERTRKHHNVQLVRYTCHVQSCYLVCNTVCSGRRKSGIRKIFANITYSVLVGWLCCLVAILMCLLQACAFRSHPPPGKKIAVFYDIFTFRSSAKTMNLLFVVPQKLQTLWWRLVRKCMLTLMPGE